MYKCSHLARGLGSSTHTSRHKRAYLKGDAWQAIREVKTKKRYIHSTEMTKIWTCQLAEKMPSNELRIYGIGKQNTFLNPYDSEYFSVLRITGSKMVGKHRLIHLCLYIFIYKFLHFLKGKKIISLNFFLTFE